MTGVTEALPFVPYQEPEAESFNGMVLVGEAPGAEEARLGLPFQGRSGKLLDEALAAAGISRRASIVANVFRLRPPGNKVGLFFASRRAAAAEGEALAERWGKFAGTGFCRARYEGELIALTAALQRWQPAVIIALGRTPLWALTGADGILSVRGQPHTCRLEGVNAPVMPTFHPSYLLRGNWSAVPTFEADLKAALLLAEKE